MPLHVRRRRDTGALEIYGTVKPAGSAVSQRIRVRAGSDDEATAREEAIAIERQILRDHHLGKRVGVRSFAETARAYIEHETRSTRTIKATIRVTRYFGDWTLDQITQEALDTARAIVLREGASAGTVRRNLLVPVAAVLNFGARRGWCAVPLFDAPSVVEKPPAFLLPHQVEALEAAAAPHLRPLIRFLICTGARLSEALALEWRSVDLGAAVATFWEGETKSGRRRVVGLPPAAVEALTAIGRKPGRVFLTQRGVPYRDSEEYGGQIKTAWRAAWQGAFMTQAPSGPHILRHSWASWTYALNPDPLALMKAGGWSGLALVERYAHLLPSGYEDGIRRVWGLATVEQRARA